MKSRGLVIAGRGISSCRMIYGVYMRLVHSDRVGTLFFVRRRVRIASMELQDWIAKIKQARRREDMFAILDEFRKHEWTDEQCSTVGRLYIRLLDGLKSNVDETAAAVTGKKKEPVPAAAAASATQQQVSANGDAESELDGPVWYEKM